MPTLEAEKWRRIEEIFHLALQYDGAEREAYLARICGADQFLLDEVRSLISSHEQSGEFLDTPQLTAGLQLLAAASSAPSREGKIIGRYALKRLIGRGGMGEVYLAFDQQLARNLALKLLPVSFNDHPNWVCRFQNEARTASSIAHPNIAHVYEVGEADGQHYIAMEYIEGATLREYIRCVPLEPLQAIDITIQVARALSAAHSTGMLHRDIKPDNIMIHRDGYVKVLDFGLAKSTAGLKSQHEGKGIAVSPVETAAGILVGSPAYMSPEQARGMEVDGRSDLWSLGVVLYELLTQKNPFLSETPSDTIATILKTEPPPLGLFMPGPSEGLERIVTKLLSKAAEDRYQSAESLIADLCSLKEELKRRKTEEHHTRAVAEVDSSASPSTVTKRRRSKLPLKPIASTPGSVWGASTLARMGLLMPLFIALIALLILRYSGSAVPKTESHPITSIAVLPFVNESAEPNTKYISDGLSESLIERFSRLSRIKVIARNSSFNYREKSADLKNIAQDLNVQALIIGRVRLQGDDLQVNLELVDVQRMSQLWVGQYQQKSSDIPLILNDIARNIAAKLNLGLSAEEMDLITRDQKGAGDAYEWYLKGRFYWNQLTEESLDKSIECFNEALAIHPQYALAYTGLANSYSTLGANYRSPEEAFHQAEIYAQKALAIDSSMAEAHYAMGAIHYMYYWNLPLAEQELKRALELNPNYAMANSMLCALSITKGDMRQATGYINRALELDPLSLLFNARLSSIYYLQCDYEKAIRLQQKILSEHSDAFFLYNDMAIAYAQMKRFDEAFAASQRATILMGQDPDTLSRLGIIYALSGRVSDARWLVGRLEQISQKRHVQAYSIASIYAALGDKNQAFIWLNKAREQRSSHMLLIKVDPIFDKIRSDLRYIELLESVNFD
ncbi:MAG TPA: protein kinase [Pyrinomonadaceae bacterium]|jgi:serine/threonine-protein kinase